MSRFSSRRWSVRAGGAAGCILALALAAPCAAPSGRPASPAAKAAAKFQPSREARRQLAKAVAEARHGNLDLAFLMADALATANPHDNEIRAVRDTLQQRAVMAHLTRAHNLGRSGFNLQAVVEYRSALAIDPGNADAQLGLAQQFDAGAAPSPGDDQLRVREPAPPIEIAANDSRQEFHLRGGLRSVIGSIMPAYGLKAYVANNVPDVQIRLDIADATFPQTMRALRALAPVDYVPLDPHTLYFGTGEQILQLQPLAERTFYLPWVRDAATLTDITNSLRAILDLRQAQANSEERAITVRAMPEQLDAAERVLLDLEHPPGEVLLEVRILEVNRTVAQALGISAPDTFQMFSLGPLLEQLEQELQTTSLQTLLNDFFSEGGLNGLLESGELSSSLLEEVESQISPLLEQPFVTIGGGVTLMAITLPSTTVSASDTVSNVSTIDDAWLRADSGQVADLKIGERYPVVNATFSPIYLSSAIAQVVGNGSYIEPFPSFTYEDLGVEVKLTPRVTVGQNGNPAVDLAVEAKVQALAGSTENGMPVLTSRDVNTEMFLRNGEPALMAGMIDREEELSLTGIPGLSSVPGLGLLFSESQPQKTTDELVIEVTPHVVGLPASSTAAIWLPPGFGNNTPPAGPAYQPPPEGAAAPGRVVPQVPGAPVPGGQPPGGQPPGGQGSPATPAAPGGLMLPTIQPGLLPVGNGGGGSGGGGNGNGGGSNGNGGGGGGGGGGG